MPDHPVICKDQAKQSQLRHDNTAEGLRQIISWVGMPSSNETAYRLMRGVEELGEEGLHRSDILAIMPGGESVMIDVTVVHPCGQEALCKAWHTYGATAKWAEKLKRDKWQGFVDKPQYEFVPFALESYGRLGPSATAFLSRLGDIAAASGRVSKSRFMMNAYRLLSCTLQRGNSAMYSKAQWAVARAKGKNFMPGLDVPFEGL